MQDISLFIAHHLGLTYGLSAVLILLMFIEFVRLKRHLSAIGTPQAIQLINRQNAVVVDIRSKEQFSQGHIVDAQSIPAADLLKSTQKLEKYRSKPLIIVCTMGVESQKIAAILRKQGYDAFSLASGIHAWSTADLPLIKKES